MIYHICEPGETDHIREKGFYEPAGFAREGFIHFSTKEQILNTAKRFYNGMDGLEILEVDETTHPERVHLENTSGGKEQFPHYYAILPASEILRVIPFPRTADGNFVLPPEMN